MGAAVQLKAGKYNETPLHTAARIENGLRCVEMLIKSGAAINALEEVTSQIIVIRFTICTFRVVMLLCILHQKVVI